MDSKQKQPTKKSVKTTNRKRFDKEIKSRPQSSSKKPKAGKSKIEKSPDVETTTKEDNKSPKQAFHNWKKNYRKKVDNKIKIVGIGSVLACLIVGILVVMANNSQDTQPEIDDQPVASDNQAKEDPAETDTTQGDRQPADKSGCQTLIRPLRCVKPVFISRTEIATEHNTEKDCWVYLADPDNPEDLIVYDISNVQNGYRYPKRKYPIYGICGNNATGRFQQERVPWPDQEFIKGVVKPYDQ